MTATVEHHAHAVRVCRASALAWRATSDETLAALLARPFPADLRWAIRGDALLVTATLPRVPELETRRLPRLAAAVARIAEHPGDAAAPVDPGTASVDPADASFHPRDASGDPADARVHLDARRVDPGDARVHPGDARVADADGAAAGALARIAAVVAHKGWRTLDGGSITIPDEPELPPMMVTGLGPALRIARSVPLLPARRASAAVRAATLHAALRLNAAILFARVALDDPAALTFTIEHHVPIAELDEDELDAVLEGVRYGARSAAGALACLRLHPVAVEYAAAHDLPAPGAAPEAHP